MFLCAIILDITQDFCYNISMKKDIIIIKVQPNKLPNKLHFTTQLQTRAHVFRDRTKFYRKQSKVEEF